MVRAAVLIGVGKTGGGLAPLNAVGDCVSAMKRWARRQGISETWIASINDLDGRKVTVPQIMEAIEKFSTGEAEQLIVYFAGHGYSGSLGDFWLLSEAPNDANAAVNVTGSEVQARRSVFSHVVLISDACRVPAKDVPTLDVSGGKIFTKLMPPGVAPSKAVDQFFSSVRGNPAFEVKVGGVFHSIYTDTLVDALNGRYKSILEEEKGGNTVVLRPWPLKKFLPGEVARRLQRVGISDLIIPDAIITSEPSSWVAIFGPPVEREERPDDSLPSGPSNLPPHPPDPSQQVNVMSNIQAVQRNLRALLVQQTIQPELHYGLSVLRFRDADAATGWHSETKCGLVIAGADIKTVKDSLQLATLLNHREVRITETERSVSVLLQLDSGNGVLVPAFPGFVGHLQFGKHGGLEGLSYEPSSNTPGWGLFAEKARRIRTLRAVLNAAAIAEMPRLDEFNKIEMRRLESAMQYEGGIDLSIVILTAYAYFASHREMLIPRLWARTIHALGSAPIDVEMLLPERYASLTGRTAAAMPPFPVYARGWAIMDALEKKLPSSLTGLQRQLTSSPWTMVDAEGVNMISEYLDQVGAAISSEPESALTEDAMTRQSYGLIIAEMMRGLVDERELEEPQQEQETSTE